MSGYARQSLTDRWHSLSPTQRAQALAELERFERPPPPKRPARMACAPPPKTSPANDRGEQERS